jgi:hypothetical protein
VLAELNEVGTEFLLRIPGALSSSPVLKNLMVFLQSYHGYDGIAPQIGRGPLPFTSFVIQYSLIILKLDAVCILNIHNFFK